jgi:two-component sensor histidine kinase
VQTFPLALHELATNATKHGALSEPKGQVAIRWSVECAGGGNSRFENLIHFSPMSEAEPSLERSSIGRRLRYVVLLAADYQDSLPVFIFADREVCVGQGDK